MAWEVVDSLDKVPTFKIFRPSKYDGLSISHISVALAEAFMALDPSVFFNESEDQLLFPFWYENTVSNPVGSLYYFDGNELGFDFNNYSIDPWNLLEELNNGRYSSYDCTIILENDFGTNNYFLLVKNS